MKLLNLLTKRPKPKKTLGQIIQGFSAQIDDLNELQLHHTNEIVDNLTTIKFLSEDNLTLSEERERARKVMENLNALIT